MQTVLLACVSFPELGFHAAKELEVIDPLPGVLLSQQLWMPLLLPKHWRRVQALAFQRTLFLNCNI